MNPILQAPLPGRASFALLETSSVRQRLIRQARRSSECCCAFVTVSLLFSSLSAFEKRGLFS